MIIIFSILFGGFLAGVIVRKVFSRRLPDLGLMLTLIVPAMLLCFGMSIGGNRSVMADFHTLGLQGVGFGLTAMAGSAVACMWLQNAATEPRHRARRGTGRSRLTAKTFMGSVWTLVSFISGIAIGIATPLPDGLSAAAVAEALLYLLILTVAAGMGNRRPLSEIFNRRNAAAILLPVASVAGTFAAGAMLGLLPTGLTPGECIASISGMGYYSLSSVLIDNLKTPEIGATAAMRLGAIALIGNIAREFASIVLAPVIYSKMGTYALIGASGVTSMDVSLPTIATVCGDEATPAALLNGVILEAATPFLVTAACMI